MNKKPPKPRRSDTKGTADDAAKAEALPSAKARKPTLSAPPGAPAVKTGVPGRPRTRKQTESVQKRKVANAPAAILPEESTIDSAELKQFIALKHPDPHRILGAHFLNGGVIMRAFKPGAEKVEVVIGTIRPLPMAKTHAAGLFEVQLGDLTDIPSYRFKVHYPDCKVFMQHDPYSFLPTVGDLDLHLFGEGSHEAIYQKLGAHVQNIGNVNGVSFAVWAPQAEGVSVVGDFNSWNGASHQMRMLGGSGVWVLFIPDLTPGTLYKYEIRARGWPPFLKADPYAFHMEIPPNTSSIVYESKYQFHDQQWLEKRAQREHFRQPLSIYEVHLGSWRRVLEEDNRPFRYCELAPVLAQYVKDMGFTHVEFLPLKEHPYGPSWGYQVGSYFAASARYGTPDDLRYLIDYLHQQDIGVIMDWVPAHFPRDAFALGRFDGSALYEHLDPRKGEHPDWGTYIFNYGRNEVRNFLMANALYWFREFHLDGLRVDAVASMLYLDYSRKEGEWVANQFGGRECLEAISLLKELNEITHRLCPGIMMIAEESTSFPQVSHPTYSGGLGFDFKWNMGWMHDTLKYFQTDPLFRAGNHNALTFGFLYAWSENFILPFSHDEVVHMKGALLHKMPGDNWQKFANLRALYGYMWSHPGKKMLFMGGEFGQWREWNERESLDWHLLEDPLHKGVQTLIRDLNRFYREENSLWEADSEPAGFQWIDANNASENIVSFIRRSPATGKELICVCNFSPIPRDLHRLGLPKAGKYPLLINTDDKVYAGEGGEVETLVVEEIPLHGQQYSAIVSLPPLATLWFEVPK
ncbi:MAG: 1,4-alpha-glucan branching protein GlgB [Pyrinomonadaceae bacterium]|nr:1,4-alpha-glucan branching protein GlgB [Pyrinomonadaceae bacterium]